MQNLREHPAKLQGGEFLLTNKLQGGVFVSVGERIPKRCFGGRSFLFISFDFNPITFCLLTLFGAVEWF